MVYSFSSSKNAYEQVLKSIEVALLEPKHAFRVGIQPFRPAIFSHAQPGAPFQQCIQIFCLHHIGIIPSIIEPRFSARMKVRHSSLITSNTELAEKFRLNFHRTLILTRSNMPGTRNPRSDGQGSRIAGVPDPGLRFACPELLSLAPTGASQPHAPFEGASSCHLLCRWS